MRNMSIKMISADEVASTVRDLFIEANTFLPTDLFGCITCARDKETHPVARQVLDCMIENATCAKDNCLPICQDTGMAVLFADVGEDVHIVGDTLQGAADRGVREAYVKGALRLSIVEDPLFDRVNTDDNTPALVHIRTVPGDKLTLTAAPKGFGSENMSALRMFTPAATAADIKNFVVETVKKAGSNPCPPITIGVGIGADFEGVACLAKRALILPVDVKHPDARYAALEGEILDAVNALGIGPQGFGGDTTALCVHILTAPTHIAGLPCAVNIGCHVNRHTVKII